MAEQSQTQAQKSNLDPLQVIMEKLTRMEESIRQLNLENGRRAQEIATLAKHNNLIETCDESSHPNTINEGNLRAPSSERRIEWLDRETRPALEMG